MGVKERLDIQESYALLEINDLMLNESADYECVGKNSLGVSRQQLNLIVLSEKDYSKIETKTLLSLMSYNVVKGNCFFFLLNLKLVIQIKCKNIYF